jgi:hypothetical protein
MSDFVVWETIRRTDSRAIAKRNAGVFSSDAMNLTGRHNFASSGSQSKAVGITAVKGKGKKAILKLVTKVAGSANKPKKAYKTAVLGSVRFFFFPRGGGTKTNHARGFAGGLSPSRASFFFSLSLLSLSLSRFPISCSRAQPLALPRTPR